MGFFKLERLKIKVFSKRKRSGFPRKTLEAMFNPESYSMQYQNNFTNLQGINSSSRQAEYSLSEPQQLSIKLIYDGTGVYDFGAVAIVKDLMKKNDVYKKVQEFIKYTTEMDGKIHEPTFLKVEWGDLIFKCRLQTANVTYTMFDRGGKPLRAEIDATFLGDVELSERLKKENKSSPDLTHVRVVKAGDTLPLLTEEIYGSPEYYLEVARVNKLNDFRNLKPGTTISFPPLATEQDEEELEEQD